MQVIAGHSGSGGDPKASVENEGKEQGKEKKKEEDGTNLPVCLSNLRNESQQRLDQMKNAH